VNTELVFLKLQPTDFPLRASFLHGVLHLLVFGVGNLIANGEQTIDGRGIDLFQPRMLCGQTCTVRGTP